MKTSTTFKGLLSLLILFLSKSSSPAFTQSLATDTVNFVVESVVQNIIHNYPFPDISAKYAIKLRKNERQYRSLDADGLAKRITADLRLVHKDVHLNVVRKSAAVSTVGRISALEQLQKNSYGFSSVELDNQTSTAYIAIPHGFNCTQEGFEMAGYAMNMAAYSKNVIIDLRENRGGAGGMGHFLASYFFAPGEEKFYLDGFEKNRRNFQEYTYGYVPGKRLNHSKLYILTSRNTGSAAEGFAFAMQRLGKAIVVGDTTAGAGIAGGFIDVGADLVMFIPLKMIVAPGTDHGWEGTGVIPDVFALPTDAREKVKSMINNDLEKRSLSRETPD